jgi:ABC-type glycerol-3-phosphate transport system substrate-binding protein
MKIKQTRVLALALAGIIALTLSGCGKSSENLASKDYVFRTQDLAVAAEFGESSFNIISAGDSIFLYGMVWDSTYTSSEMRLVRIDEAGNLLGSVSFDTANNIGYNGLTGSNDGRIFAIKVVYPIYEGEGDMGIMPMEDEAPVLQDQAVDATDDDVADDDTADDDTADDEATAEPTPAPRAPRATIDIAIEDNNISDDYVYQPEQYYLVELLMDGSERELACLNDNPDINNQDWFYVGQVFALPNNLLLVNAMEQLATYDLNGNYQGLALENLSNSDEYGWGRNYLFLRDGRTLFSYYGEYGVALREFNISTGFVGEQITLSENRNANYSVFPGAGYDLFLANEREVYGYNIGGEMVKLMDVIDSDLFTSGFSTLYGISPEQFMASYYDESVNRQCFALFTKVPPEEVQDKIELVLGGNWVEWDVRREVVNFNKSNEKYRITIIDYGNLYANNDDWNAGLTRLNTDIVSGRAPDIMLLGSNMPSQSYMAKGLFADLLPFIEKDPDLDVDNLMPNVVEAFSMDGKLYQLVPHYYVYTAIAKTANVGSDPGWTIDDAEALLARQPEGTTLFDMFMTRETLLQSAMTFGEGQFIDWTTGRCYFDSPAFIKLLELMSNYSDEIDYSFYERVDFWDEYQSAYRNGRILMMITTISNLRDYNRTAQGQFGGDVTPIGFPTEGGNGAVLTGNLCLTISAKSRNRDGAWEFLRTFLSEEYQKNRGWSLPILRSVYDQQAQEATERPFWIDENGVKQEYDDTWWINDQEIILQPMTRAEVDRLTDYILSVRTANSYNQTLMDIINEEAAAYFAGQKSVQEVVAIIQSRAQIYVSENS